MVRAEGEEECPSSGVISGWPFAPAGQTRSFPQLFISGSATICHGALVLNCNNMAVMGDGMVRANGPVFLSRS